MGPEKSAEYKYQRYLDQFAFLSHFQNPSPVEKMMLDSIMKMDLPREVYSYENTELFDDDEL